VRRSLLLEERFALLKAQLNPIGSAMLMRWLALFVLVVAGMDYAGVALTRLDSHVATLWPAKGFVLAVLLFANRRNTLLVLAGAALASLCAKFLVGETLVTALPGTLVSLGGAAATAAIVRALSGPALDFRDWRLLTRFFGISWIMAALTALPGAAQMTLLRGIPFDNAFVEWVLATGLSYVVVVPPLMLLATLPHEKTRAQRIRIALASALVALVTLGVFSQSRFPISYTIPLTLAVVGVAAGIEAAAIGLLLVAVIAVPLSLLGHGPATMIQGPVQLQILAVQLFLVLLTMTILPVAAAVNERDRLRRTLEDSLRREHEAVVKLAGSEERYRMLAEQSKDIIVHSGRDGIIRYVSPGCRAFGYEPEDLIGIDGATLVHPDDAEDLAASTARLLRGEKAEPELTREHRFRKKSGEYVWLQGNPTVTFDRNGEPAGIINFFRDVSEHKARDLALAEAMKKAEAATIAKTEFLANMSHEIRTPLTGVVGFSQLLQELPDLSETAKRYAARIAHAAQGLLAVVNDILDFSKLEAGQIDIRPEPGSPREAAADVLNLLMPQATRKSLVLSMDVSPALPSTVMIDIDRLRQVLINLVGNAVKFTRKGEVTLSLDYSRGRLVCTVTDTGPGIPQEKLASLFQRFSQVDGSIGRAHGGTGLGLAICKGLVDAMGGEISATSKEGEGSVFQFSVPAPAVQREIPRSSETSDIDLSGLQVLAVDDNPASLLLVENVLKSSGARLVVAENGAQAVTLARARAFDLILMDLHMPGLSGADAAAEIRAASMNCKTPIYAFTSDAVRTFKDERNAGVFSGVILKPFSLSALRRVLRDIARAA